MKKLLEKRKDSTMTFEELGVDSLFVDEAHNFKNLSYYTKLNVAGSKASESGRAEDMYMKTEYVRGRNGVIVFATATPITNSVSEMYNTLRYIGPSSLANSKTESFDAWASAFGMVDTVVEMAPDGVTPRVKERFSKFRNRIAMVSMFRQFADIKKTGDVITSLPEVKRVDVISPSSELQKAYIETIKTRMSNIAGRGQNRSDNMLLITNDGRAMATDMRLVAAQLDEHTVDELDLPESKINNAVKNIKIEYDKSNSVKGTQFVFLDFGRNENKSTDKTPRYDFGLYDDLINKIKASGIPESEIAVFQEYKTDEAKKRLFSRVNNGDIRVLIGSTAAMGEGVNAQNKSVAMHHINPPYRPSDIEQREGRMIRHGNENNNVTVYRYIQQGSFDSYIWQMLARKAEMIDQALNGVDVGDEIEDIGEVILSLREARAIASNNPLLIEKADLENKLKRLRAEKRTFDSDYYAAKDRINKIPDILNKARNDIANIQKDIDTVNNSEATPIIRGKKYEKSSEAGKAIIAESKNSKNKPHTTVEIGTFRGLRLSVYNTEMLGKYFLYLDGAKRYSVEGSESDTGVVARLKNEVESFTKVVDGLKTQITSLHSEYETVKKDVLNTFPKQTELDSAVSRLSEINNSLNTAAGLKTEDAAVDSESFGEDEVMAFVDTDEPVYGSVETIPRSLTDIRKNISRRFNIPVNTGSIADSGRYFKRSVKGIFKVRSGAIRLREINDLRALSHELGHSLAKKYPSLITVDLFDDVVEHYKENLAERGYKDELIREESFAEYISTMLQDADTAINISNDYFITFSETLSESDKNNLSKSINESNAYFDSSRESRQKASIKSRTDEGAISEAYDKFVTNPKEYTSSKAEKLAQDWYDKYSPIRNAEYNLTGSHSAYDRFAYIDVAGSKVWAAFHTMLTDLNGNHIGTPLANTIKKIATLGSNAYSDFDLYLKNRRAAYLSGRGIKVYATEDLNNYEKLQEDISKVEISYPEFNDLANEIYEFNKTVLWEYGVNSGLISDELFNKLTEDGSDYVPLYRVMDDMFERIYAGTMRGAVNQKAPIKRIHGSTRDTYSPLENLLLNTDRMIRAGMKNEAARKFADVIDQSEDSAIYMEKIEPSKIKQIVSTDALKYRLEQALGKEEAEMIIGKLSDSDSESLFNIIMESINDNITTYKTKDSQKPNVVTVMRGGEASYYEVHSETLYKALTVSTPQNASQIAALFSKSTQLFKTFTTAINPYFIVSNIQRDYMTGAVKSMTAKNLFKYSKDLFGSIIDMAKNTDDYKLFLSNGGHWSSAVNANKNALAKVLKELNIDNKTSLSAIKRSIRRLGDIVAIPMELAEQSHRFAEFKRTLADTDNVIAASRAAHEVTTNFHRSGLKSKNIDKFIPYFQASINGIADLYQTFIGNNKYKGEGVSHQWFKILRISIYASALEVIWNSLIAGLLFGRDDDEIIDAWDMASAYRTNNYWSFYFDDGEEGGGKFIRIAKPHAFGAISTFMTDLIRYFKDGNEDAFAEWGTYLAGNFLPPYEVIGLSTIFQFAKNEDGLGRTIISDAYADLPAKYQYNENTSYLAVKLGGLLNASPLQIDAVLSNNFGFVGRLAKAFPISGEIDPSLGFGSVIYYDPVYSTDIINNLYDARDEYVVAANGYNTTEGNNPDYVYEDVYNANKYTKLTSLYSGMNKQIREDDENGREARRQLNAYLDEMQKTGMTKIDVVLADIVENTGVELSDISVYVNAPSSVEARVETRDGYNTVKNNNGDKLRMETTHNTKFAYFKIMYKTLTEKYAEIFQQQGITYENIVEQLKQAKSETEKDLKNQLGAYLYSLNK